MRDSHAHFISNSWRYTQHAMQPPLPVSYTCKLVHSEASPISWATLWVDVTRGIQSWKGIHWRASGGNEEKMQFLFTDVFLPSQDTHLTLCHTVPTLPYSSAGRLTTPCRGNCTNYKPKYGTVALLACYIPTLKVRSPVVESNLNHKYRYWRQVLCTVPLRAVITAYQRFAETCVFSFFFLFYSSPSSSSSTPTPPLLLLLLLLLLPLLSVFFPFFFFSFSISSLSSVVLPYFSSSSPPSPLPFSFSSPFFSLFFFSSSLFSSFRHASTHTSTHKTSHLSVSDLHLQAPTYFPWSVPYMEHAAYFCMYFKGICLFDAQTDGQTAS